MDTNKWFNTKYDSKRTILENFENLLEESKKTDDIISFISVMNAKILVQIRDNDVPEKLRNEILEFYYYFIKNYEQKTRKVRINNWPNDALILRMGATFAREDYLASVKEEIEKFSSDVRREAESLLDTIFNIRKDKIISIVYSDGKTDVLQIPRTIPREELDNSKTEVLFFLGSLVDVGGSATVRLLDKNGSGVFGVLCKDKKWSPVSKFNTEWAHTHDANGNPLPPEKGTTYTEISRPETYLA